MTTIKSGSALVRETSAQYRGRPLIIELRPGYMILHPKGLRTQTYDLDYEAAFHTAIRARVLQIQKRNEKNKQRRTKSKSKGKGKTQKPK